MRENKMYQVSTLQALALGYSRPVIRVRDLLSKGDIGLGTFENVNGEMIVMEGCCYRADQNGQISQVPMETGVPFATVGRFYGDQQCVLEGITDLESIKTELTKKIEEDFGLNSMHVVKLDGEFEKVDARSEAPYKSQHITLKTILSETQKAFVFENIRGSLGQLKRFMARSGPSLM